MREFSKTLKYIAINLIFSIICLLFSISGLKLGVIAASIFYIIYIILLKEKNIITNQIILLILINSIYDTLWRKTSLEIPMDLKYLIDIMSLILIIKIIIKSIQRKEYYSSIKDPLIILVIIFFIVSAIVSIVRHIDFSTYLMVLRVYLRFVPIYIVISVKGNWYNKYDFFLLLIVNVILIFIQSKISFMDDISGVFGLSNVQTLLLLLIIVNAIATTFYNFNKINRYIYILIIISSIIICAIAEIKIGFVFIPFIIAITMLINNKNILRNIVILSLVIFMIPLGIKLMLKIDPKFEYFFEGDIKQNIINYTMKTNNSNFTLGRIENILYSNNYILKNDDEKILGLGIGSSMPSENWYYEMPKQLKDRDIYNLYKTRLYDIYGFWFGYHFSSMNIIYLETGLIGIIIYLLAICIIIVRSFRILQMSKNVLEKSFASASISLIITLSILMFYYSYLLDRGTMLMTYILIALTTNIFNRNKLRNKTYIE